MLVVKDILDNKEAIIEALSKRKDNAKELIGQVLALDADRKKAIFSLEDIQAESNKAAKEIGMLFKEGKAQEANELQQKVQEGKARLADLKSQSELVEKALRELLYTIPNVPHKSVPVGKSENDNEEIKSGGTIPTLHAGAVPHWDLLKTHDLVDFEVGVKITGAGFPVYKGKGARLQRALINFFLDEAVNAGYSEVIPPLLVNEVSGYGTGQLPDKEGQMYHTQVDNLYLIPTAEIPITNMYRDEIISSDRLPIKNVAYTPCFRREAGSYGKDVRGLNRLHQFDKVEIVQVVNPADSYEVLETMKNHVESLLTKLGLPFRILRLCSGDLGFTAALTFDFEVFSTAQDKWLEVSSVSNFETYQSNRLKLRFREGKDKPQLAHTLNGSALALPRILASILENYQTPEGIVIPEVLVPYTGFDIIS
ncbi:MAG: seryl-tRNA synthetase [Saprospiraceae bacterium]|jgi:seryl-tRNA synthetase